MENKYSVIYTSIISKSKNRPLDSNSYYERHHIIPRALGGSNLKDNLVYLTPKEHYVCHHLLTKFTEGRQKRSMLQAWNLMSTCLSNGTKRYIPAVRYDFLKRELAEAGKKDIPWDEIILLYNQGYSTNVLAKKYGLNKSSIRRKFLRSGIILRSASETRATGKNPKSREKGWKPSEKALENMSKGQRKRFENSTSPFKGGKHSPEALKKMSEANLGIPRPDNSVRQKQLASTEEGRKRLKEISRLGLIARWGRIVE